MKETGNSATGPQAPTSQAPTPRTSTSRAPTPRTPGTRAAGPTGPAPLRPVPPPRTPHPAPAAPAAAPPSVVVIVPTRDEAENVGELLGRLDRAIPQELAAEVLFVDDSRDSTPDVIRAVARFCRLPVAVHHRERPEGGLGGAVAEGIRRTAAPWIVVMDADLQHPAELVPRLVLHGEREGAELVVASRYADGGSRDGLAGTYRTAVSRLSTLVVKAVFPQALRSVSDPMSGFFAIRRAAVERTGGSGGDHGSALRPLGYKILLELAVRCRPRGVAELPYTFGERFAGRSKSTVREGLRFLRHVAALRTASAVARLTACALIGLSGFAPNLLALKLLTEAAGLHYVPAAIVANQLALLWNFLLTDRLLYADGSRPDGRRPGGRRPGGRGRHRKPRSRPFPWPARLLGFAALANADMLLRLPLTVFLVSGAALAPVPATAVALLPTFLVRFLLLERVLYRPAGATSPGVARRSSATEADTTGKNEWT
ncbi:MAG TPA: dolichol-phosphate mannosyltransferase [Streptomyces sp.]|nr:dolichol-phosphate mannosyltransferase [Streptomyces sp.]